MRRRDGDLAGATSRAAARALALLALVAALGACGPAYRGEPLYGPLDVRNPRVGRGERVYALHCDGCHPGGDAGLGPSINDKPLPGWLIELQVRVGFGAMPGFDARQISDDELDALVTYLMALRAKEPTAATAR